MMRNGYSILKNSALWLWRIRNENGKWYDDFKNEEGILNMEEALFAILLSKEKISSLQNDQFNEIIYNDIKRLIGKIREQGFNGTPYLDLRSEFNNQVLDFVDSLSYFFSVIKLVLSDDKIRSKFNNDEINDIKDLVKNKIEKILNGAIDINYKNENVKAITWLLNDDIQRIGNNRGRINPSAYFTYSLLSGLYDAYSMDFIDNELKIKIKNFVSSITNGIIIFKGEYKDSYFWSENLRLNDIQTFTLLSTIYIFMSLIYSKYYFETDIRDIDNVIEKTKNFIIEGLNTFMRNNIDPYTYTYNPINQGGRGFGADFIDETFWFEALNALTLYGNFMEENGNKEELQNLKDQILEKIFNLYESYNNSNENKGGFFTRNGKSAIYMTSPAIESLIPNVIYEKTEEEKILEKFDELKETFLNIIKENSFDLTRIYNFIIECNMNDDGLIMKNLERYITDKGDITKHGPDYIEIQKRNLKNILNLLKNDSQIQIYNSINTLHGKYIDVIEKLKNEILNIDKTLEINKYRYYIIKSLIEFNDMIENKQNGGS
ncbi:MAG: hypothetical protein ACP5IB_08695 [Thermoplasmata archaeon]